MMYQHEVERRALLLKDKEAVFLKLCLLKVQTEKELKRMKPELTNLRRELLEACL